MTPTFSVYGFDARIPLLEHRPFSSVHETAEYYVEQLTIARPTGPYRFFGFVGGLLALEMARQLCFRNAVPLVVLGDADGGHRPLKLGARLVALFRESSSRRTSRTSSAGDRCRANRSGR
jgi:thioesterase domain-containing protein